MLEALARSKYGRQDHDRRPLSYDLGLRFHLDDGVKYFVTDAWLRAISDSILEKDTLEVVRITQTASV